MYCLCRQPDNGDFMIGCDYCTEWYHGKCVGITKKQSLGIKKYSCPKCEHRQPTLYHPEKRKDEEYSEEEEDEEEEEEDDDDDEEVELPAKRKEPERGSKPTQQTPPRKVPRQDGKESVRSSQEVSSSLKCICH